MDRPKEDLSWNSSNDEDVGEQTKGRDESEGDKTTKSDDDDNDDQDEAEKVNDDDDNEEEVPKIDKQEEEEDAEELYRDVDINQGRGLQVSQETEDSHVILTPTQSDA
uniref:Uncharacterized protein n=1 Tax=Tanacetum cinerariifolium TaxID=118510 RepID=A0A6L2KTP8_TANCI|nr:hypothetical protein [Tanacetum cinerariifolium]